MALGITEDETTSNNKNSKSIRPSAPPLESTPSNDLNQIRFVVTSSPSSISEPISAQKAVIIANQSLRQIIEGKSDCDSKGNHIIRDVNESDFRQFIEFLENKKLEFNDQNHRLQMFSIAKQYNCSELQIYCLREIDDNLNVSNVITVYRTLWIYGSLTQHENSLDHRSKRNIKQIPPDEFLALLLYNVLQFIHMNAEIVLLSDEIEQLSFKELGNIVKQDDLLLRSEMVLITALARWSRAECRRKHIELTNENERTVLGELIYAPRFVLKTIICF